MNITLPDGNTKSLVLIKDLSYIPLCEEGDGFKSTEYSGWRTGCRSNHTPRYICKKKKEVQTTLF